MTHNSLRISARISRTLRILLFLSTTIEIDRYDGVLLVNEHGDLYFYCIILVYKLSPLNKKNIKNLSEGKKDMAKNVHKARYPEM